ncbi:hypothetical protein [Kineococcus aurantiacus]|uniref:Uncharacterized protein n=1 Tax=Kineococcus aurantiacus TaxID=37633 RepID=A0A7Y9J2V9_9ACTN|nr:hypothetical protein [Kineococcus aurantiacus]NYD24666.1 hypothetical protein [Kineococcus aurantiacus]
MPGRTPAVEEALAERSARAVAGDAAEVDGAPTESDGAPVERVAGGAPAADPPGKWTRLGRLATATLTRRNKVGEPGTGTGATPDVVTAGEALVRLVDRLVGADPDDRTGRLASVLGRLEQSLRDAVVTTVAARSGGHVADVLRAIGDRPAEPTGAGRPAQGGDDAAGPVDVPVPAGADGGVGTAGTQSPVGARDPAPAAGVPPVPGAPLAGAGEPFVVGAAPEAAPAGEAPPVPEAPGETGAAAGSPAGVAEPVDVGEEGGEEGAPAPAPAQLETPPTESVEAAGGAVPGASAAPPAASSGAPVPGGQPAAAAPTGEAALPAAGGAVAPPVGGEAPGALPTGESAATAPEGPAEPAAGVTRSAADGALGGGIAGPPAATTDEDTAGVIGPVEEAGDTEAAAVSVTTPAATDLPPGPAPVDTPAPEPTVAAAALAGTATAPAEPAGTAAPGEGPAEEIAPGSQPAESGPEEPGGEPGPGETSDSAGTPVPDDAVPPPATGEAGEAGTGSEAADGAAAGPVPTSPVTGAPASAGPAADELVPAETVPAETAQAASTTAELVTPEPVSAEPEAAGGVLAGSGLPEPVSPPDGAPLPGGEPGVVVGQALPAESEPTLTDPPAPTGGGGGGGAALPDRPTPSAPDVSTMSPQAALGTVASLPASVLARSLPGVTAAAQRTVSEKQSELAANPPTMPRPSGVPADRDASLPAAPLPPLPEPPTREVPVPAGGPGAPPPQAATPPPPGPPVALHVPEPTVGGDKELSAEDVRRVERSVDELPTTDPALDVTAGPVPALRLVGDEDPARVATQAKGVEELTTATQTEGLADARTDTGENDVFPHVPEETLVADLGAPAGEAPGAAGTVSGSAAPAPGPAAAGPSAGGPAAPGGASPAAEPGGAGPAAEAGAGDATQAAVDAVAAERGGAQIGAATTAQGTALGRASDAHSAEVATARAETEKQINAEIAANGEQQTQERRAIRSQVGADRRAWVEQQDRVASESRGASTEAVRVADGSVTDARSTAEGDSRAAIKGGDDQIRRERAKAEQTAREQREKAREEKEGGGFFGWLGSKLSSFFSAIKKAISAAFDLARKAVDAAISAAQKLAVAAIELGRRAVVAAIELGGRALKAAGDIVLAGFPKARAKFRAKIDAGVAAATKTVNQLADTLKAGVTKLLDALGAALKGALTLLEKAYTAAVDVVAGVVDTVVKAAKAFVDALLDFAAIAADIAGDPLGWLRNLGAGLKDGVSNHTWPALVTAVKEWFKAKVESVVGVGRAILDVLKKGGITFAKVVTMAWTAIKEALPGILIQLLIEKLVALLIPAAGALSLIIDGLRAAWGAAERILAAFKKFIAFLKAVRGGASGPLFGQLVGAAAVAVLDFLSNFVLSRLKGAGQKVGGTLRALAGRFRAVGAAAGRAAVRGARVAVRAVTRGARAAVAGVRRAGRAVLTAGRRAGAVAARGARGAGAAVRHGAAAVGRGAAAVRSRVIGAVRGVGRRVTALRRKVFGGKDRKRRRRKETKEQRVARAIARTRAAVSRLLVKGVSSLRLRLTLGWLKRRWGWKRLELEGSKKKQAVMGEINPRANIGPAVSTLVIIHSTDPALVGTEQQTLDIKPVTLSKDADDPTSTLYEHAILGPQKVGDKSRLRQIAEQDFPGRAVRVTAPAWGGRRTKQGRSTLKEVLVNLQMKFGRVLAQRFPGLRPDARTALVRTLGGQDQVHIYEVTTVTNFVLGDPENAVHKQVQALTTLDEAFRRYPGAIINYTFIAPDLEEDTIGVIKKIIARYPPQDRARLNVRWRKIGFVR